VSRRAVEELAVHRLGRIGYDECHELQRRLVEARQKGLVGDVLLLLEHPPVLTLGRAAKREHVLLGGPLLEARGVALREIGRGGDVTFHGPGQLVGYPIVDLKPDRQDVRKYVWTLEETMIRVAADHGLSAGRVAGMNGAWIGDRKLGAVGVRIGRWVTMHGFALNVSTDLSFFDLIVPCGIRDKGVTSLGLELGSAPSMREVEEAAAGHFAALYEARFSFHDGPPALPT
jgi:lipoyl(octanoyl) transferase